MNASEPQATNAPSRLDEIRARWADRTWPSIGYFVHGQALTDIDDLLDIIDAYDALQELQAAA